MVYPSDSGITLERGASYTIQWTTTGLPAKSKLKVELVKGGSDAWILSAGTTKLSLKWTVGKTIKNATMYADGDDYRIRVSTLDDSDVDSSDNDFAIGSVTSLTVSGPATVLGGAAPVQYTCTAHYNFGADRDVTNSVKWSATKIKGVKMGKTGLLATALVTADLPCTITAAYGKGKPPITGTLDITITP